jgi:uncharacterized membrane protein
MRSRWFGLILALVAAGASAWAIGRLPAEVELPWLGAGDSVSALKATVFLPTVMAGVWLLLQVFPAVDPRGTEPYTRFRSTYWLLSNTVMLFLLAAHALMLAAGTGLTGSADRWLLVGAGVLAAVVGNSLSRVEPNWFFGLRTPWTLSDADVWRRTHRVMGRVIFGLGLAIVALAPFITIPAAPLLAVLGATLALASLLLSYIYWRQRQKPKDRQEVRS